MYTCLLDRKIIFTQLMFPSAPDLIDLFDCQRLSLSRWQLKKRKCPTKYCVLLCLCGCRRRENNRKWKHWLLFYPFAGIFILQYETWQVSWFPLTLDIDTRVGTRLNYLCCDTSQNRFPFPSFRAWKLYQTLFPPIVGPCDITNWSNERAFLLLCSHVLSYI